VTVEGADRIRCRASIDPRLSGRDHSRQVLTAFPFLAGRCPHSSTSKNSYPCTRDERTNPPLRLHCGAGRAVSYEKRVLDKSSCTFAQIGSIAVLLVPTVTHRASLQRRRKHRVTSFIAGAGLPVQLEPWGLEYRPSCEGWFRADVEAASAGLQGPSVVERRCNHPRTRSNAATPNGSGDTLSPGAR
jgi:hypothetical protein